MNTPAKSNWFLTHWRGEASLGISYWLNGILLGSILPGIVIAAYVLLNPLRHYLRTDAVVVLALTALTLTLWVWTVVGIIRSANRHTARGGKLFWANTARVIDHIIATPPESMWYPTEDELKEGGVLN